MCEATEDPRWAKIAEWYKNLGVFEMAGEETSPLIRMFFEYTKLRGRKAAESDETAWCSAFVCACMEQAGFPSTKSAMARTWERWGIELIEPKRGCIVVLWRGNPKCLQGHVGFYMGKQADRVILLGGNQHNSVCIESYPQSRVLSYRWPA